MWIYPEYIYILLVVVVDVVIVDAVVSLFSYMEVVCRRVVSWLSNVCSAYVAPSFLEAPPPPAATTLGLPFAE